MPFLLPPHFRHFFSKIHQCRSLRILEIPDRLARFGILEQLAVRPGIFNQPPQSKWSLLYGVVLCTARAMGQFGAVSVVSGHIRGRTNTLPLHVEILYNEYEYQAAFAVASLLVLLALASLVARRVIARRVEAS